MGAQVEMREADAQAKHGEPPSSTSEFPTMTPLADEMADLGCALRAGDWTRLGDVRLDLVVLDDPSAWPEMVRACAVHMATEALRSNEECRVPAELFSWFWDEGWPEPADGRLLAAKMPRCPEEHVVRSAVQMLIRRLPEHQQAAACLRLVRRLLARWTQPDLERALLVLGRWPLE